MRRREDGKKSDACMPYLWRERSSERMYSFRRVVAPHARFVEADDLFLPFALTVCFSSSLRFARCAYSLAFNTNVFLRSHEAPRTSTFGCSFNCLLCPRDFFDWTYLEISKFVDLSYLFFVGANFTTPTYNHEDWTFVDDFTCYLRFSELRACEIDKMGHGCRINNAQCSCGYGCKAEYRYKSMEECKDALTGEGFNACNSTTRCLHGGSCLQITSQPGFKCLCEGTGYFGYRCEKPCPGPENPHYRGPFPYECVVI